MVWEGKGRRRRRRKKGRGEEERDAMRKCVSKWMTVCVCVR